MALLLRLVLLLHAVSTRASPAALKLSSCAAAPQADPSAVLRFDAVYGEIMGQAMPSQITALRLVAFGTTGAEQSGYSSATNYLATVLEDTSVASFSVHSNSSALCSSIRTPATPPTNSSGCPFGPGDIALGVDVPLRASYSFATIMTRIRVLDSSVPALQLGCYDVAATPYYPSYWAYRVILWASVGLFLGYWLVIGAGRLYLANTNVVQDREAVLASSLTERLSAFGFRERIGPVVLGAIGGAALQASASARRFATPSARDALWTIQFTALLGAVAVNWPGFACASSFAFELTRRSNFHTGRLVDADLQHHAHTSRVGTSRRPRKQRNAAAIRRADVHFNFAFVLRRIRTEPTAVVERHRRRTGLVRTRDRPAQCGPFRRMCGHFLGHRSGPHRRACAGLSRSFGYRSRPAADAVTRQQDRIAGRRARIPGQRSGSEWTR